MHQILLSRDFREELKWRVWGNIGPGKAPLSPAQLQFSPFSLTCSILRRTSFEQEKGSGKEVNHKFDRQTHRVLLSYRDSEPKILCLSTDMTESPEKKGKEANTGFGGPVVSSLYHEEIIR